MIHTLSDWLLTYTIIAMSLTGAVVGAFFLVYRADLRTMWSLIVMSMTFITCTIAWLMVIVCFVCRIYLTIGG